MSSLLFSLFMLLTLCHEGSTSVIYQLSHIDPKNTCVSGTCGAPMHAINLMTAIYEYLAKRCTFDLYPGMILLICWSTKTGGREFVSSLYQVLKTVRSSPIALSISIIWLNSSFGMLGIRARYPWRWFKNVWNVTILNSEDMYITKINICWMCKTY